MHWQATSARIVIGAPKMSLRPSSPHSVGVAQGGMGALYTPSLPPLYSHLPTQGHAPLMKMSLNPFRAYKWQPLVSSNIVMSIEI